jgi:hypothetical protein
LFFERALAQEGTTASMASHEATTDPHRQQQLYWNQMISLKVDALYIRLYRDFLGRWVTWLGALKAIASCGGIAAWVVWRDYAFVWAAIIAASQVADALKDVFPFAKRHKAACEHAATLSLLFIDAQLEWESVFSGQFKDEEVMSWLHRLRSQQYEAEQRNFPEGLTARSALLAQAEQQAAIYSKNHYGVRLTRGDLNG